MTFADAVEKARQILHEERISRTISYSMSPDLVNSLGTIAIVGEMVLHSERGKTHPRIVRENTAEFSFKSLNFNLLSALLDQLSGDDKPQFITFVASQLHDEHTYNCSASGSGAGSWIHCSSELPLIAEFLVRRGDKQLFIKSLSKAPLNPGLTLLLLQLEEMIALNFTLFTEQEYLELEAAVKGLLHIVMTAKTVIDLAQQRRPHAKTNSTVDRNVVYEGSTLCNSILEECRKAKYLYIKGSLLQGVNLEINQDKERVSGFLAKLGFSPILIQSLDEADRLYRTASTPFELKSCLGHMRSFIEKLHLEAAQRAYKIFAGTQPTKWGEAIKYLQDNGVFTKQEWNFFAALYTLVSDAGVHPLIADREYARLMRNMSIECGLLLLTKVDKLGLSSPALVATP